MGEEVIGHCATCRYWEADEDRLVPVELRRCRKVKMFWDATQWSEDFDRREFTPECATDLAFAQDGSDYRAELITRAEFGCVQWEPDPNAR